jgi:type II secretory pathway pseudopilin PulG
VQRTKIKIIIIIIIIIITIIIIIIAVAAVMPDIISHRRTNRIENRQRNFANLRHRLPF